MNKISIQDIKQFVAEHPDEVNPGNRMFKNGKPVCVMGHLGFRNGITTIDALYDPDSYVDTKAYILAHFLRIKADEGKTWGRALSWAMERYNNA